MHKDQQRVMDVALPAIAARIHETTPQAERDCTVLNRLLIQGPDPLYLMESTPGWLFADLCSGLGLDLEVGRAAIESAHWQGPAVLLGEGSGIRRGETPKEPSLDNRREALWLILASMSDCTEEGYVEEVSLQDRIRRANAAVAKLAHTLATVAYTDATLWDLALESLDRFYSTTEFKWNRDDPTDIPTTTEDHGFYIGYKEGFSCVRVIAPNGLAFIGTPPEHSLAEQGITVDKEISPQFGIIFPKE